LEQVTAAAIFVRRILLRRRLAASRLERGGAGRGGTSDWHGRDGVGGDRERARGGGRAGV